MVEFEEIKDEHYQGNDDDFVTEEEGSDGDYSDTSSEGSAADDDNLEIQDESLLDRIVALKDIVPAHQRDRISRVVAKGYSYGSMATYIGGKAAYILLTSVLLLGIPFALLLDEERSISEQERQMQEMQAMNQVCLFGKGRGLILDDGADGGWDDRGWKSRTTETTCETTWVLNGMERNS